MEWSDATMDNVSKVETVVDWFLDYFLGLVMFGWGLGAMVAAVFFGWTPTIDEVAPVAFLALAEVGAIFIALTRARRAGRL